MADRALMACLYVGLWVQLRLMLMVAVADIERCSVLVAVRRIRHVGVDARRIAEDAAPG